MLLQFTSLADLNMDQLMQIYSESNLENAAYFYPDDPDREKAVRLCEEKFLEYLENDFYSRSGRTYWILEENGQWVSALRTSLIRENIYYIEALETKPDCRKQGYAVKLLRSVAECLKADGPFFLFSNVSRKNVPSLRTHIKSGFWIASDPGYDYLQDIYESKCFGMEYCFNDNTLNSD